LGGVPARTFIVRVSDSPPRVVIEDVRSLRTVAATDLDAIGPQIATWLREAAEASARGDTEAQPDSR
jgi:hypothetical protein